MQRPPSILYNIVPALVLTLFGAIGLVLLALLAGVVASILKGSGFVAAVARIAVVGVAFLAWLYTWRRLTLWFRNRACS